MIFLLLYKRRIIEFEISQIGYENNVRIFNKDKLLLYKILHDTKANIVPNKYAPQSPRKMLPVNQLINKNPKIAAINNNMK